MFLINILIWILWLRKLEIELRLQRADWLWKYSHKCQVSLNAISPLFQNIYQFVICKNKYTTELSLWIRNNISCQHFVFSKSYTRQKIQHPCSIVPPNQNSFQSFSSQFLRFQEHSCGGIFSQTYLFRAKYWIFVVFMLVCLEYFCEIFIFRNRLIRIITG